MYMLKHWASCPAQRGKVRWAQRPVPPEEVYRRSYGKARKMRLFSLPLTYRSLVMAHKNAFNLNEERHS